MIGSRQEKAFMQSDFYRNCYYKMLRGLIVSSVIIFLLVLTVIYFVIFTEKPKYYATTTTGQIIPMVLQQ